MRSFLVPILLTGLYFFLLVPCLAQSPADTLSIARYRSGLQDSTMDGRISGTRGSRMAQFYIMDRFAADGFPGCSGVYEQAFFFRDHRGKVMGTNLVACVKGSMPGPPICLIARYGSDSPVGDRDASSAAVLLCLGDFLAAHHPAHSFVLAALDGDQGENALLGSLAPDSTGGSYKALLVIRLEDLTSGNDSLRYGCSGPGCPALLSTVEQSLPSGGQITKGPPLSRGNAPAAIPLLDWHGGSGMGDNAGLARTEEAIQGAISALDKGALAGPRLPSEPRWVMLNH